jgi:uncharacterized membrane protein YkgB
MRPKSVAIVTGASQGIGEATAIRLARDFSAVALVARNRDNLEKTAREVEIHRSRSNDSRLGPGSDIIGLTEIAAAILLIGGYFKPKAGIVGGPIATLMFFITSTMVISTTGAIISVPGIQHMRYMSFLGLFLFKDVISLGVSFYLISYFGRKAILSEDKGE